MRRGDNTDYNSITVHEKTRFYNGVWHVCNDQGLDHPEIKSFQWLSTTWQPNCHGRFIIRLISSKCVVAGQMKPATKSRNIQNCLLAHGMLTDCPVQASGKAYAGSSCCYIQNQKLSSLRRQDCSNLWCQWKSSARYLDRSYVVPRDVPSGHCPRSSAQVNRLVGRKVADAQSREREDSL